MKAVSVIVTSALALVFQGGFTAAFADGSSSTGGHCVGLTVTDYISSDHSDGTTSTTWVNVADGHLNFTTAATGCVVITFSGLAGVAPKPNLYEFMHVRTLLDGNSLCIPALALDVFTAATNPSTSFSGSITRICRNVTAGRSHSVQVQYRGDNGGSVSIDAHVLTVTHT